MRITPDIEAEVRRLINRGYSERDIASRVQISRSTVRRINLRPRFPESQANAPIAQTPPEELAAIEAVPVDISTTQLEPFETRVDDLLDRLLGRYGEILDNPDTPDRTLIALGRLLGSWSSRTRPKTSPEEEFIYLLDAIRSHMSEQALTELLGAALGSQRELGIKRQFLLDLLAENQNADSIDLESLSIEELRRLSNLPYD